MRNALLILHTLGAIVWVGGMFFAHFCLRPAAAQTLQPANRLPLMEATLRRFFAYVGLAVAVLLASGLAMLWPVGLAAAPVGWHVMLALGIVMSVIFLYIWLALHPRFRAHCAAAAWPAAGQVLQRIRGLVGLNLALGACAVVAAFAGR